jgi:hypothetical protein
MEPVSDFDRNALELLAEIGVTFEADDNEYEFTPGFDPETGEWQ